MVTVNAEIVPDSEILEYVCAENEKSHQHLIGTVSDSKAVAVTVAAEVLAQYVGSYELDSSESDRVPASPNFNVTMFDGALFMDTEGKGRGPLIPGVRKRLLFGHGSN
jgi:hypothetical protein